MGSRGGPSRRRCLPWSLGEAGRSPVALKSCYILAIRVYRCGTNPLKLVISGLRTIYCRAPTNEPAAAEMCQNQNSRVCAAGTWVGPHRVRVAPRVLLHVQHWCLVIPGVGASWELPHLHLPASSWKALPSEHSHVHRPLAASGLGGALEGAVGTLSVEGGGWALW